MDRDFSTAGFVVICSMTDSLGRPFKGMDLAESWPLEDLVSGWSTIKKEFGIQDIDGRELQVATGWEAVYAYWQLCRERWPDIRLLLVESERVCTQISRPPRTKWVFLGYDATYPAGNYSAIYYEVLRGKSLAAWTAELNENGLFESLEQLDRFLADRNKFLELGVPDVESAGMAVVPLRLWEFAGYE